MASIAKALADSAAIESFHNFRVDPHAFSIYVGGDPDAKTTEDEEDEEPGVEHRMADRFEQNLYLLSRIDPDRPLLVQMASVGGNWDDGMQMFGAMLTAPNPITFVGLKWCRSMSSIIPLAADRFLIRPPTRYMIHRGKHAFDGLDQEADTTDIERRKANELMYRIYAERMHEQGCFKGQAKEKIQEAIKHQFASKIDMWLSSDEAVAWGFADGVYTGKEKRIGKKNASRRARMMGVLRQAVSIEVKVR